MSYRCSICRAAQPARTVRKVWPVYRETMYPNGKVKRDFARELPVCGGCLTKLRDGADPRRLAERAAALAAIFGGTSYPSGSVATATTSIPVRPPAPPCDTCGGPVGEGQVMADTVICPPCIRKGKSRV